MLKNIIFDLGVVLLDVDYGATIRAFSDLGLENPEMAFSKAIQDDFFQAYEKGLISDHEFLTRLSQRMGGASKESIRSAWCAMLGELPLKKFQLLQELKREYRLFILSNTNSIHQQHFESTIQNQYGWESFEKLFDYIGYSHRIKQRKPDPDAFITVMKKGGITAGETLFIDDTKGHVEACLRTGLKGLHYQSMEDLERLLKLK